MKLWKSYFFHPGLQKKIAGFINAAKNENLVFIVKDSHVDSDYFRFIKLRRGRVITPSHGEIDFSRDDIPVATCKKLYDLGFPYLELTELGKTELYGKVEGNPLPRQVRKTRNKNLE